MLTARGWWLLILTSLLTLLGVLVLARFSATVPILGFTLLAWFFWEWFRFQRSVTRERNMVKVVRRLLQGGREVPTAWAGSSVTIEVQVLRWGTTTWPVVILRDALPLEISSQVQQPQVCVQFGPSDLATIRYQFKPPSSGLLRFEGVDVRVSDEAGLFYARLFVRDAVNYLVLPPLTDDEGRTRGVKKFNTLPPPGIHRMRKAGSGSELLDLRDYRPGDPPKMVAWKASARRDRLITKEFESDVPLRCVLFLDQSNSARIGPPGQVPLTKLGTVAAALAQAAAANRDLVGLTLFDADHTEHVAPARTRLHIILLLRRIAEAIGQLPRSPQSDPDLVARYAIPVAQRFYPELLTKELNARPWGLYWLPIADTRWMWLLLVLFFSPLLLIRPEAREALAQVVLLLTSANWSVSIRLALVIVVILLPLILTGGLWLLHGIRGFFQPRYGRTTRRKQLASLFSTLDQAGPAQIERYLRDDAAFNRRAEAFLQMHRLPLPLISINAQGEVATREPSKVVRLANTLARAVSLARDNELYVILADFADLKPEELEPLVAAVRMARARHHQIIVMLSWPAGLPNPSDPSANLSVEPLRLKTMVQGVLMDRLRRNFQQMRSALSRVGATVLSVDQHDAIPLVLEKLEQLRAVRVRR